MSDPLVETWHIHNRINLYLLDAIAEDALPCVSASKGRTVGEQIAHLHAVRLMWLKAAAPARLKGLETFDKKDPPDRTRLRRALLASGEAVAGLLIDGAANGGKIKGFKPHATAFLGYLVAHESHHRGQILLTLKQSGRMVDKKIQYGLWEWGVR